MKKVTLPLVPPPGDGLRTLMPAVPGAAISAAPIAAVNCVALTNVVGRALPFQRASELGVNPVPVSVSVKAGPPSAVLVGLKAVSVGLGLFTVKFTLFVVPGAGCAASNTTTATVPPLVSDDAGMGAVHRVALLHAVARSVEPKRATEVLLKPSPLTVSVTSPPPAVADVGEMELSE